MAFETSTYVREASGLYVYCLDTARFMNDADNPITARVQAEGLSAAFEMCAAKRGSRRVRA